MKHILSILILLGFMSSVSAGVGDVYYCQSTKVIVITPDKVEEFAGEQFTFKRNPRELVFGDGGYFNKSIQPLTHSVQEWFRGNKKLNGGYIDYRDGKFGYASWYFNPEKTTVIMANCNTFE